MLTGIYDLGSLNSGHHSRRDKMFVIEEDDAGAFEVSREDEKIIVVAAKKEEEYKIERSNFVHIAGRGFSYIR